jgi:hypothetical protein
MPSTIVIIIPITVVHELVVTIPLVVFSYDSRIKTIVANTKVHEFIVFKPMTCKNMTRPTIRATINSIPSKRPNRKALNYPKHVKGVDFDTHICVFKTMIRDNGEMKDVDIVNFFEFTL